MNKSYKVSTSKQRKAAEGNSDAHRATPELPERRKTDINPLQALVGIRQTQASECHMKTSVLKTLNMA